MMELRFCDFQNFENGHQFQGHFQISSKLIYPCAMRLYYYWYRRTCFMLFVFTLPLYRYGCITINIAVLL